MKVHLFFKKIAQALLLYQIDSSWMGHLQKIFLRSNPYLVFKHNQSSFCFRTQIVKSIRLRYVPVPVHGYGEVKYTAYVPVLWGMLYPQSNVSRDGRTCGVRF